MKQVKKCIAFSLLRAEGAHVKNIFQITLFIILDILTAKKRNVEFHQTQKKPILEGVYV
jgi:hypothetical protein